MKKLLFLIGLIVIFGCQDSKDDKAQIISIMKAQEKAWTENNIEEFMTAYWKSNSLKFYGSSGLTYGWQKTLDNYEKRYPSADHTGTLSFEIDDITQIQSDSYYVMGQYFLKRTVGDTNGVFMIIFKKIDGEWKIVADLSC